MFFGYRMVGLAFLTNFISVGFGFYSYGVFFKTLVQEFGGSRLAVSAGLTSLQLMSGLSAPFVGRFLDHGQSRHVMSLGAFMLGAGFVLASRISGLPHFYLIFGLVMGVAVPMLGGVSSSTLVANWFVARRGAALGVAAMGISVSGVVMPPLGTYLISLLGWRSTFLVYAAIAFGLVLPAVFLWAIHRPEDLGQRPDGLSPTAPHADHEALELAAPSSGEIVRDRNFAIIAAVIALNFSALGALLTHAVPHATDLGFSPQSAALVLSAMAGAGSIGKPVFGALADRIDKRSAVWMAAGLQLCGSGLLHRRAELSAAHRGGAACSDWGWAASCRYRAR